MRPCLIASERGAEALFFTYFLRIPCNRREDML